MKFSKFLQIWFYKNTVVLHGVTILVLQGLAIISKVLQGYLILSFARFHKILQFKFCKVLQLLKSWSTIGL